MFCQHTVWPWVMVALPGEKARLSVALIVVAAPVPLHGPATVVELPQAVTARAASPRPMTRLMRMGSKVASASSRVGLDVLGDHPHGGGLAGAVRAHEAHHLAAVDGYRRLSAEDARQRSAGGSTPRCHEEIPPLKCPFSSPTRRDL